MPRAKDKERILQAAREKQLVTYKGVPIRLSADFSTETMQARWEWQEIFKVINSKNLQPNYSTKQREFYQKLKEELKPIFLGRNQDGGIGEHLYCCLAQQFQNYN
ncbi:hypothetical protein QTO34_000242 [Cnephaeus nilssonii]|uniref:Uncharacterized protein n=1 Tax=Cnephaeus nilssonii TaxID=3371016 RepID=A0AA40IBX4_CNENI|nr:hypothetical protein QTO34_000242 [Eptesicus nilssonii]